MTPTNDELQAILNDFLERWSSEEVEKMTLEKYVSVGDRDTFCQWIETRTRMLGSIKGLNSAKFGIYRRKNLAKHPKRLHSDAKYSWRKVYGEVRSNTFHNIKNEVLEIIKYSTRGEYGKIDELHMTNMVKWKIAYLHSNNRIVPIFKQEVLHKIARDLGMKVNRHTAISEIQQSMIANKPARLSVYEYARDLWERYGGDEKKVRRFGNKKQKRRSTKHKNTRTAVVKGKSSYIVSQKHNVIQNAYYQKLIALYGENRVKMEEDNVDIRVIIPDGIILYEVKASSHASECVKDALGQILAYAEYLKDKNVVGVVIVGQYPPNESDEAFIKYVKRNLRIPLSYESCPIE